MPAIDHLFNIAPVRRFIWQCWYPFLTRRTRHDATIFLNYGYEEEPALGIPLKSGEEPDRACIQLYHQVAAQVPLAGKEILEVSCGHGGGAAYLARTFRPASYTALDLNPEGIRFCREHHRVERLNFLRGDAEHLPFDAGAFDAVINVEASHCYPDFPRFLKEVARVLRPGGHFLYTDFRFRERQAEWESALDAGPLRIQKLRDISAEVVRGMDRNSSRSQALVVRHLPGFLHGLGSDFAGTKGSRLYNALKSGEVSYRTYCLIKAG